MDDLITANGKTSWTLKEGGASFTPIDPGTVSLSFVSDKGKETTFEYSVTDTLTPEVKVREEYSFPLDKIPAFNAISGKTLTQKEWRSSNLFESIVDNDEYLTVCIDRENSSKIGIYPIVITVSDRSGNKASYNSSLEITRNNRNMEKNETVETSYAGLKFSIKFLDIQQKIDSVYGHVEKSFYYYIPGEKLDLLEFEITNTGDEAITAKDIARLVRAYQSASKTNLSFNPINADTLEKDFSIEPGQSMNVFFFESNYRDTPNDFYYLETDDAWYDLFF